MTKAPAGCVAQVPAEYGCSAVESIITAKMFRASGRMTHHSYRAGLASLPATDISGYRSGGVHYPGLHHGSPAVASDYGDCRN